MTPDTAALRELADTYTEAPGILVPQDTVRALCDAADEVERLRKAVWASEEIDRRAGMLAGVQAERDASRTAHDALVAELRALPRADLTDTGERPGRWVVIDADDLDAALDRHAPEGETP